MRHACPALLMSCACALLAACSSTRASPAAPAPAAPNYSYVRHYVSGQVTRYTYTERQAGAKTQLTAVAQLTSYVRGGIGGEQVRWIMLTDPAGVDLSAQARAFPPYDLSLDPSVNGLIPPRQRASGDLQGPVEDLLTFFVDLSSRVGITGLHRPGQSHVDAKLLAGNFTTATTPVGQDLIQLTTTLIALNSRQATFRSSYQPPPQGGLKLYRSWMDSPVCGQTPNNFELVQAEGSKYTALWGCESFTVTTVVDRSSGQIVSVQMTNPLKLQARLCRDKALTGCTAIPDSAQERVVQLSRSAEPGTAR